MVLGVLGDDFALSMNATVAGVAVGAVLDGAASDGVPLDAVELTPLVRFPDTTSPTISTTTQTIMTTQAQIGAEAQIRFSRLPMRLTTPSSCPRPEGSQ